MTKREKRIVPQKEKDLDVLDYMHSITQNNAIVPEITTVSEWNSYWLKCFCVSIKDSTYGSYESAIRNHIDRVLGKRKLSELTNEDVQLFVDSLKIGLQLEEEITAKTIKNIHGVLHKSLSVAVKLKLIPSNPADDTILPPIEKKQPTPLNDNQLFELLRAIQHHPKKELFLLAIYTGLREAELVGLTWDCFDFDNKTMRVYRQISRNRKTNKYEFTSLKNGKTRVIVLPQCALEMMVAYRDNHRIYNLNDFVFKSKCNTRFTPAAIYKAFKKVVCAIGIPETTFHDLRHTNAVLSLKAGMDIKTLQSNLGHHSAAFTLDVYGHCLDEMKRIGANKLDTYIDSLNLYQEPIHHKEESDD